ncbi:MAG: hypothetical protein ACYCW6_07060 [Candidatus Xenobia bacterium]
MGEAQELNARTQAWLAQFNHRSVGPTEAAQIERVLGSTAARMQQLETQTTDPQEQAYLQSTIGDLMNAENVYAQMAQGQTYQQQQRVNYRIQSNAMAAQMNLQSSMAMSQRRDRALMTGIMQSASQTAMGAAGMGMGGMGMGTMGGMPMGMTGGMPMGMTGGMPMGMTSPMMGSPMGMNPMMGSTMGMNPMMGSPMGMAGAVGISSPTVSMTPTPSPMTPSVPSSLPMTSPAPVASTPPPPPPAAPLLAPLPSLPPLRQLQPSAFNDNTPPQMPALSPTAQVWIQAQRQHAHFQ